MKTKLVFQALLCSVMMLFVACEERNSPTIKQGIYGYVIEESGGLSSGYEKKPVSSQIYVYETIMFKELISACGTVYGVMVDDMPKSYIITASSNDNGFYQLELPSGEYSIFILDGESLNISHTGPNAELNPVTIEQGISERDLILNHVKVDDAFNFEFN